MAARSVRRGVVVSFVVPSVVCRKVGPCLGDKERKGKRWSVGEVSRWLASYLLGA